MHSRELLDVAKCCGVLDDIYFTLRKISRFSLLGPEKAFDLWIHCAQ